MANDSTLQVREKEAVETESTRPGPVFRPDVDILENGNAYLIYADMPGVDDQHIQVRLDKGVLSIDAELAIGPGESWDALHTEYSSGSYHRQFRLSDEIDSAQVSASMKHGVLELRLPKVERHQPRQITVQVG